MKKRCLFLCLVFSFSKYQAQNSADNKLGTWYMFNGSHQLSDKFALKTMAHFRYFETTSEFQQEIYRLGANYKLNPKTNVTLGLSYATADVAYNSPSFNLYEWRIYEDLNLKSNWGVFTAKQRFRLEHRFIHRDASNDITNNWIRYDLNLRYPLAKNWHVYIFNEIFLNIDRNKRFSQNWTGTGLTHKLNENIILKTGYLQIKTPNTTFKRLQIGVILHTNHIKKD